MSTQPSNYQWPSCTDYLMGDRGTLALGVATTQQGIPDQIVATEDFETDPITGSGTWATSLVNPHTGIRCLQSATITHNQNTDYTFSVPGGATEIRFWWRVSSEQGFDFFEVYVDSVAPANLFLQASGTSNTWAQHIEDITGATSIIFRYVKDGSVSVGLDLAAIDDIEWVIPGQPAIELYAPFKLTPDKECVQVALCNDSIAVSGIVDIRPLDCDTDSITVCPPASGVFEVTGCVNANVKLTCEEDSVTVCPSVTGLTNLLDCETDSVTVCPPASGVFEVTGCVNANVKLTCEEDSVTVCPSVTGLTNLLDCETDSVTVCPPVSGFDVTINPGPCPIPIVAAECIPVNVRLDCEVDSVTVCPGNEPLIVELSGPVSGTFDQRPLECDLDFVTVCPPESGVFDVNVTNEVNIRPLDCVTDSVTVCLDDPIDVNARTATLNNGTQVTVGVASTLLSAANANRRSILIQNVGGVAARVGTTGVTATTGFKLNPGGHLIFNTEDVPTNAIFAIRDGASDTTVLVQEVVM